MKTFLKEKDYLCAFMYILHIICGFFTFIGEMLWIIIEIIAMVLIIAFVILYIMLGVAYV